MLGSKHFLHGQFIYVLLISMSLSENIVNYRSENKLTYIDLAEEKCMVLIEQENILSNSTFVIQKLKSWIV